MNTTPNPTILCTGHPTFPRYLILADESTATGEKRYWTGAEWTDELRHALLYAHQGAVGREVMRITAVQPDS